MDFKTQYRFSVIKLIIFAPILILLKYKMKSNLVYQFKIHNLIEQTILFDTLTLINLIKNYFFNTLWPTR
jgi:hypothetical protein